MKAPTNRDLARWRADFACWAGRLRPNRRTGDEVVAWLKGNCALVELTSPCALAVARDNVLGNPPLAVKLAPGQSPRPAAFALLGRGRKGLPVYAFVDRASGCFFIEGSDELRDRLTAFQGLDAQDLNNAYMVSNYVRCLKRFGLWKENANGADG